jgi:predicted MFS family arabinose efflux permease
VQSLRAGLATLRAALATPELRRLQAAWAATSLGTWMFYVVLSIYAFNEGGAAAVGVAGLVRLLPAGMTTPFTSLFADRRSRRDILLATATVRTLALILIVAAVALEAPLGVVLVLAAVETVALSTVNPAQASLLPLLARTPEQLAAANVSGYAIESAGFCLGALLGGALAAGPGMEAAFAAVAVAHVVAALMLRRVPRDAPPPHREARAGERLSREVLAGLGAVIGDRRLRLVIATIALATLAQGVIDVLVVVVAMEELGIGEAGVGWLNAAWGVGGILGGAAVVALLGGGRLASGLGAGCVLVGAALAGVATWQAVAPALVLLVVVGVGFALIEVGAQTLAQRLASDDVLGRVFGVVEGVYTVGLALGAALGGAAVGLIGVESTLLATAAVIVLVALATGRPLARLEASVPIPEREFALLRGLGIFAPLPIATLETLAARLEPVRVADGDVVVREGDPGDRCYVIAEGEIALSKLSGWHTTMRTGDFFGELALLRDAPRNATATAAGPGLLLALGRDEFLAAVTGQARTQEAADALVSERMASGV